MMQKSTLFILTVLIYLTVTAQEIKNTVETTVEMMATK